MASYTRMPRHRLEVGGLDTLRSTSRLGGSADESVPVVPLKFLFELFRGPSLAFPAGIKSRGKAGRGYGGSRWTRTTGGARRGKAEMSP